jgi:N-acetylglucosaminyldiphosphoundecaprenol N-acetyl-beta-D-mannosaminyltransferase
MLKRILLVQPADIGDLVVTTPAIAALRDAHPEAHLTLLTTAHSAPVIAETGLVDEIITLDRRQMDSAIAFFHPANLRRLFAMRRDYDAIVYFRHFTLWLGTLKFALMALASGAPRRIGLNNGKGWFLTESLPDTGFGGAHEAQHWLNLVGLLGAESAPRAAQATRSKSPLPRNTAPRVVIHAGSGGYSLARRWSPAAFAQVADALQTQLGAEVVLVGTADDDADHVAAAMQTPVINLSGQTRLDQLTALIAEADLYIGADSGVMHLATTTDTPVLAIFGPSNPAAWGPWTPESRSSVVRSGVECSPCSYVGQGIGLREGCEARTCMRLITPEQVITAAQDLLQGQTLTQAPKTPKAPESSADRVRILGLPVDAITYAEWLTLIGQWVQGESARHVCTVNPEFVMIARSDPNFYNILQRADLCVPDGVGLLWAARRQGTPLPERVTGSDGVPIIAEHAAKNGWRLFFLGAAPGVADEAADILRERHPGLQVVDVYSGSPAPEEEDAIVQRINAAEADILFVAYGAPVQDKWIARNLPRLQVKMAMGVGGSFDFIAGKVPRAPQWMQRFGLEWLYRLYLQPWRVVRMMRLPRFVLAVLWEQWRGKAQNQK